MNLNDILNVLVSVFQFSFSLLEMAGNLPNVIFLIVGIIGATYWTLQLKKHSSEPNN